MTASRPHVLYVAWGFPPCRGGGVYRALATANLFAARCDVTALTIERESFVRYTGADLSLESRISPGVRVRRTPFAWPTLDTNIRNYPRSRVFAPRFWARARKRRDQIPFPEAAYGPWRVELEGAARAIHAERPVDLVVVTANPATAFTAAWAMHEQGVPYILDYRDAWSLDVFSGERIHSARSRVGRWERKLINNAQEIWFVNSAIREWHQVAYPDAAARMEVVENGWDPDFAPEVGKHRDNDEIVFGYIGTVSPKVPLAATLHGWEHARARDTSLHNARIDIRGYLGYYAQPNARLQHLIERYSDIGVGYGGPVAKADVRTVYGGFDVLLLILGKGRYVTSGKVYEYMASGLPIVSVHDPGNAASDVLRNYPLWIPVASLEAQQVSAALRAASDLARKLTPEDRAEARAFAERYSRNEVLKPRVDAATDRMTRPISDPMPAELR